MNKKLVGISVAIVIVAVGVGYSLNLFLHSPIGSRLVPPPPQEQLREVTHTSPPGTTTTERTVPAGNITPPPSVESTQPLTPIVFTSLRPTALPIILLLTAHTDMGAHIYKVGRVTTGMYSGADVLVATVPPDGPSDYPYAYRFINWNGKLILIAHNSNELFDGDYFDHTKFTIDTTSVFSSLLFPNKIAYNNISFTLDRVTDNNVRLFDEVYKNPSDLELVFTEAQLGNVYTDTPSSSGIFSYKENGFYIKAPDGTLRAYSLDIPFYDKNHNLPAITWNGGVSNTIEYINTDRGGCGAMNYASVTSGVSIGELVAAGKTSTGDFVYQLKDSNHTILQEIYKTDYNPYNALKLSYTDFITARPVFFWFDPLGRLIKFQRADFLPQAECGKPVIYLYPQKTTNVSVKIDPQGGLTKSEPVYNTGWNVVAMPDGQLIDIQTGTSYPYLFWEGRGGIYNTPQKGFVVAALDTHDFLIQKLTQLGLNQKEQADFMEFWEPRMTGTPYFFVTFLGNREMDHIAPLTILPKPDSIIRILMDFTPLQNPVAVDAYDIQTPVRKGFTVVEWGGVLR